MNIMKKHFSSKKIFLPIVISLLISSLMFSKDKETITFYAEDGLRITADLYITHELTKPFIILYHQAGWSRGEYLESALKFNNMGFNCMAVDLRSGEAVNGVENETYKRAAAEGKSTDYISAYTDMAAALKHAKENYAKGKLVVLGSSYSSSLAIKLASDYPDLIDGVLAFSPGEYFTRLGKSENFITDAAKKVKCPVFITSAKNESENWRNIYTSIPGKSKEFFIPVDAGHHGSRALWKKYFDSGSYWLATKKFLRQLLKGKDSKVKKDKSK